jgi:hypothetical protein
MKTNVYPDIKPANVLLGDPSEFSGFNCFPQGVLEDLEMYFRVGKEQITNPITGTDGWKPPGKISQHEKPDWHRLTQSSRDPQK